MKNRLPRWMMIVPAAVLALCLAPAASLAGTADDETTEDVLYMLDGRELHGHILSETSTSVVFELVNRRLHLKTRVTLSKDDIGKYDRGVPIDGAQQAGAAAEKPADTGGSRSTSRRTSAPESAEPVPVIYVVPIKGQMGTDIHPDIFKKVVEDIHEQNPDVVIFELDSSDYPDLLIPEAEDSRETRGVFMMEEFRELVEMLKGELSDVRQVMWVEDSVGFSSMLALSWGELYMTPEARLSGLRSVIDTSGADKWSDADVRAKMSAAYTAFVKAFLEYGGYSMEIADAMLWPENTLSASFRGREVIWSPNMQGEFVVDSDGEKTVAFRAKTAEDLLISDGTVENVDDLAFLLGYREYELVGDKGRNLLERYVDQWHKAFEQTKEWYADYNQHLSWASGAEQLKWLGRAKRDLEQIISAMKRYKAVEVRWQTDMGTTIFELEILVEQLKEQIRALKQGSGGYGGGGGMNPGRR